MKRRDFITRMAVAPLFAGAGWRATAMPEALTYAQVPKQKVRLELTPPEQKLLRFLADEGEGCHLFGGPVMSKLCGASPAWVNLIGRFDSFTQLKRGLFRFGVEPVSTPEMPASFIKFRYAGQVYNVIDGNLDSFCQSAYFSARQNRLPFAHGFLVFDPRRGELHDPCGAVPAGSPAPFRLVAQPPTPVDAFDWLLCGWFECRFLGLESVGDLPALEAASLDCESGPGQGRFVAERVMNYFPEIVDYLGGPVARKVAGSKLIRHAMQESLGVDFERAFAEFERAAGAAGQGRSSGAQFMAVLQNHLGEADNLGLGDGPVSRFMVRNNFAFRRPEWLVPGAEAGAGLPATTTRLA